MNLIKRYLYLVACAFLVACSATNAPVVIRDADSPEVIKSPVQEAKKDNKVALVSPLKLQLLDQSQQKYQQGDLEIAITLAERGLRLDRKEPVFYQVLSQAYEQLGDKTQSQRFAKQGLRYAQQGSRVYQLLLSLSQ